MSFFSRIGNFFHNDVVAPVQRAVAPQHQQPRVDINQLAAALNQRHVQQQQQQGPSPIIAQLQALQHNMFTTGHTGPAQQSIANANQQLQNAHFGVLANPATRNAFMQQQSQGNNFNLGGAVKQAFPQAVRTVAPAVTSTAADAARWAPRTAAEIALTALHPTTQHTSGNPTSMVDKVLFGHTPVQNVQKKVGSTYDRTHSVPKAGGEVLASLINDLPALHSIIGGAQTLGHEIPTGVKGLSNASTALGALKTPLNESGHIQIRNNSGGPLQDPLKINYGVPTESSKLKVKAGVPIEAPPKPTPGPKINDPNNLLDKPLQINDPHNLQQKLSGAAQQSMLSKLRAKITPIGGDQRGSIQLPGAGKRGLPDSLPNDITKANKGGNMASNSAEAYAHTFGIPVGQAQKELGSTTKLASDLPKMKGRAGVTEVLSKMPSPTKEMEAVPKQVGDLKAVTKPNGIKQLFASKTTAIRNLGTESSGKLANLVDKVDRTKQDLQAKYNYAAPTAQKLNKEDFAKAVDVLEGNAKSTNPTINKAAEEMKTTFGQTRDDAFKQGVLIGDRGNTYFPHNYDYKAIRKDPGRYGSALQHLIDSGQAQTPEEAVHLFDQKAKAGDLWPSIQGNLERSRNTDMPGYAKTKEAFNKYVDSASSRIAQATHLGTENEVARRLIGRIRYEGGDADTAAKAVEQYLRSPDKHGTGSKVAAGVRGFFGAARLGKAAISHAGQTSNTAVEAGLGKTLKAWGKYSWGSAKNLDFIEKTGVTNPQVLHGYQDQYTGLHGLASKATAPGLNAMMKMNRSVTALAGREYGNALAKAGDVGKLRGLGVEGEIAPKLTPEQEVQAARGLVAHTMFSSSRATTPINAETATGKTIGQYRTAYAYKQTGFIHGQVIKEAGKGNITPLLRYLAVSAPVGAGTIAVKNKISGNKEGPGGIAMDTAAALGGIPGELALQAARYGKRDLPKTVAGIVAPAAGEAVTLAEAGQKALNGKPEQLGKYGLGMIPIVGGRVGKAAFPSKADQQAAAKPVSQGSPISQTKDGQFTYKLNGKTHTASDQATAEEAIAKDTFKKSNTNITTVGDTVYRKSPNGKISSTPKDTYDYQVGSATLAKQKATGDLNGWFKTAQGQLDSINKQLNNPNTDPLDALKLYNEGQTIYTNMQKYKSYGGFTKGGGSGGSGGSAKVRTPKPPSIAKLKFSAPKAKFTKPKQVAYKIPSGGVAKTKKIKFNGA